MKYFFDNNISPKYAKMLAALDVDATALRDEFDASIKDVDLFPKLHGRNLVFVSGDIRIRTRLAEAQALHSCGVTALFFDRFWGKMTFWQQAFVACCQVAEGEWLRLRSDPWDMCDDPTKWHVRRLPALSTYGCGCRTIGR